MASRVTTTDGAEHHFEEPASEVAEWFIEGGWQRVTRQDGQRLWLNSANVVCVADNLTPDAADFRIEKL